MFQQFDFFGVPSNLVGFEASKVRKGMAVCLTFLTRIAASVGIHHVEYTDKLAALRDAYRVVAVTRQFFLFEQAIRGIFKLLTLPINALLTFVVVVAKHGRPRDLEAVHKVDEGHQSRACIVEFTVNNVTRNNDKIGVGCGDNFG